jgi:hypothetical protein
MCFLRVFTFVCLRLVVHAHAHVRIYNTHVSTHEIYSFTYFRPKRFWALHTFISLSVVLRTSTRHPEEEEIMCICWALIRVVFLSLTVSVTARRSDTCISRTYRSPRKARSCTPFEYGICIILLTELVPSKVM